MKQYREYSFTAAVTDLEQEMIVQVLVCLSLHLPCMFLCVKNSSTQQVSDLTVNIYDHLDTDQLHSFDRLVYGL